MNAVSSHEPLEDGGSDPVIDAFLAFLSQHVVTHTTELDSNLRERTNQLIGTIETDLDEDLGDECLL